MEAIKNFIQNNKITVIVVCAVIAFFIFKKK